MSDGYPISRIIGLSILLILVIMIIIFYLRGQIFDNYEQVRKNYNVYLVQSNYPDYKEAGQIMNKINDNNITLLRNLRRIYIEDKATYQENAYIQQKNENSLLDQKHRRTQWVKNILGNYDPAVMRETNPNNLGKLTAFVKYKGRIYSLCLRKRGQENPIHHFNTIMFVNLHEISHMTMEEYGHHDEFWAAFRFMLDWAIYYKLYSPVNYGRTAELYCGLQIDYTPLCDATLGGLHPICLSKLI